MSSRLLDRLIARIEAEGPITFADYMESALYDPEDGFFSRAPVGREFVTSAHISPLYARLLARQIHEMREAVGEPFRVVDLGAGDGTLSRALADALGMPVVCVERSETARAALASKGLDVAASLDELDAFDGVIVANELFDNIPFHVLRARDGRVSEVVIDAVAGRLVESSADPVVPVPPMADDDERLVSPASAELVASVARVLRRGYMIVVDYGMLGGTGAEPVRGYRGHRLTTDLLAAPGETDITGPVDLEAIALAARAYGLHVHGPVSQRDALESLGYREVLDAVRDEQAKARDERRWVDEIKLFGARGDAAMLMDPAGLGSLWFMVLAAGDVPAPRATAGARAEG